MFAELGYERTSLRQVGLHAGVDPGLVRHYFGKKRDSTAFWYRLLAGHG
jgi:AcrR family transcriptional regulator